MGKRDEDYIMSPNEAWLVICNASLCNPNYGVRVIHLKTEEEAIVDAFAYVED